MSSMRYCMFENLNRDVDEIILEFENGTWLKGVSDEELSHVKQLLVNIDYLERILEEMVGLQLQEED